jgi:hypothetical protein
VRSLGKAELPDHRLRFNRFSRRRQSGAADVVTAPLSAADLAKKIRRLARDRARRQRG